MKGWFPHHTPPVQTLTQIESCRMRVRDEPARRGTPLLLHDYFWTDQRMNNKNIWKWGQAKHRSLLDAFPSSTASSDLFSCPQCLDLDILQACGQNPPPPPPPQTRSQSISLEIPLYQLDSVLSTAALCSNNRLLLYVIVYRYADRLSVSSSELTRSLGCDYTQLSPERYFHHPAAATSTSWFLPDLLLSPLRSSSGKSKTPSHSRRLPLD